MTFHLIFSDGWMESRMGWMESGGRSWGRGRLLTLRALGEDATAAAAVAIAEVMKIEVLSGVTSKRVTLLPGK